MVIHISQIKPGDTVHVRAIGGGKPFIATVTGIDTEDRGGVLDLSGNVWCRMDQVIKHIPATPVASGRHRA